MKKLQFKQKKKKQNIFLYFKEIDTHPINKTIH
jgi:uncharacterized protein YbcV (DUF1398 family)